MPYSTLGDFHVAGHMLRYSNFVPRLYNLCKAHGFEPGRIMPSRSFCSDENQGYPIILIAKHFGTFPFDHGRVGGIVATDRHAPHAHHGRDLVIIQASHVGYDPETCTFGGYRRLQMSKQPFTADCGKIGAVLDWYHKEYAFACANVAFSRISDQDVVIIDNQLLAADRHEGLFLKLQRLVDTGSGGLPAPVRVLSTAKAYAVNPSLKETMPPAYWQPNIRTPIGERLTEAFFTFKKPVSDVVEGYDHIERNLAQSMPHIVTSPYPALTAAQVNTQVEFDRVYRTIIQGDDYRGRHLAYIAGLHIDISPKAGQLFPLTKFVPWALFLQTHDGNRVTMEQAELTDALNAHSTTNPDEIELEAAITAMEQAPEVKISLTNCRQGTFQ
jgi:hypothetical protein